MDIDRIIDFFKKPLNQVNQNNFILYSVSYLGIGFISAIMSFPVMIISMFFPMIFAIGDYGWVIGIMLMVIFFGVFYIVLILLSSFFVGYNVQIKKEVFKGAEVILPNPLEKFSERIKEGLKFILVNIFWGLIFSIPLFIIVFVLSFVIVLLGALADSSEIFALLAVFGIVIIYMLFFVMSMLTSVFMIGFSNYMYLKYGFSRAFSLASGMEVFRNKWQKILIGGLIYWIIFIIATFVLYIPMMIPIVGWVIYFFGFSFIFIVAEMVLVDILKD